jgi:hypothetical protein
MAQEEEVEVGNDRLVIIFAMIMIIALAQATLGINGILSFLLGGLVIGLLEYLGLKKYVEKGNGSWRR